jgi:hypothetical protein
MFCFRSDGNFLPWQLLTVVPGRADNFKECTRLHVAWQLFKEKSNSLQFTRSNMVLTEIEQKANEEHFLTMLSMCKTYTWIDYGHVYDMSSGKIVPQTRQGWSALSKIVSEKFMNTHVEIDDITDDDVFDFVRQNEMLWNADGPTASFGVMQNPGIWQSWKLSRSEKFKSGIQDVKKADEIAKQEAKKAEKKAKLLAANAAAKERDREAKEAIKKNSINHPNPVSAKITPEQVAAAEIREKERLKQLELEDKAYKKSLRDMKNKGKSKKVKQC